MANVKLFDQTGKEAGEVVLNDAVFGIEPNESVVFDVVISQRASLRQGTHAVKNRSAVSGGGRKPWRQKGTDVRVKVLFALHNGVVVVPYLVQLLVHTPTNFHKKFVDWHLNQFILKKLLRTNS